MPSDSSRSLSQSDLLDLNTVFAAKGPLAEFMPGYRFRDEQVVLASEIQQAFAQSEHCLAEAGTGVGKSLAYLIPGIDWALKNKTRLVISTHTKALQTQLMQKELPQLLASNIFGQPFKYEICLGAENYICLLRMLRIGHQTKLPGFDMGEADTLHALMKWCQDAVSGVRQDSPVTIPDTVWQNICIINDLCTGRKCPYFGDCFLQQARQRQRDATILVANHFLFFSNIAAAGKLLPEFKVAVMDEAHKVEDVAGTFLGDTVGEYDVMHLLTEIGRRGKGSFLETLQSAEKKSKDTIRQLAAQVMVQQTSWWTVIGELLQGAVDTLRLLEQPDSLERPETADMLLLAETMGDVGQAAESDEESKLMGFYESALRTTARVLDEWFDRAYDDSVFWIQRQKSYKGDYCRIHITPLDLSEKLYTMLFEPLTSVVLTSATLAVKQDFSYFESRLGVPEARKVVTDSPFAYETQAAIYLPTHMPDPRQVEAYEARVIQEVEMLIETFGGGVFVLCTSYRMLRNMKSALQSFSDRYTLLTQGEKPPQQLLQQFAKDENAIMLGVETFWQGVDVPGDALRCVVITRLPFDVPTHPVHEARAEYLREQEQNPFMTYSVPRAVLMLRQGFGRLIRHHDDRGVVAILDPRVQSRAWGKKFIAALPACKQFSTAAQVKKFVKKIFYSKK